MSYLWDRLIETFAGHILDGTSIVLPGNSFSLTNSEVALRYMALERRFKRRGHSAAILGALKIGETKDVFFRAMISPAGARDCESWLLLLDAKISALHGRLTDGYEKYRQFRTFYLQTYAQSFLMKFPHLQRLIGIATEPPNQKGGTSEDCIYAEQRQWTDDQISQLDRDCTHLGIMNSLTPRDYHSDEFPEVDVRKAKRPHSAPMGGNRKARQAERAAAERKRGG